MDFRRYTINRRVITDLRKRSTIGLVFYLIILAVVLGGGGFYKRHVTFSICFAISLTGICLFRFLHVIVAARLERISEKVSDDLFFGSVILTALSWGLGFAMLLILDGEHESKLLMSVCTAGLCAGGTIAFVPAKRLSFAYSLCMLVPAFVFLRVKCINPHLSAVVLFYAIYLILIVSRGNREYWDALENEYMLGKKSEELEKLSNTDALTNMYNRRYFNEIYECEWWRAIRNKHCLTVIICDIDHFKNVNDTYGHLAGDEYLKKVAEILKRVFKRKTDIVARYGGEEFIVLLSDVGETDVCNLAEKLRNEVKAAQITYKGEIVQTTISMGISSCTPSRVADKEAIIARADRALYEAKKSGRDRFCDYARMLENMSD